ncbi:MAG TPA: hypothetical protein VF733_02740 [Candidatus Saccharimonadales bacterium]
MQRLAPTEKGGRAYATMRQALSGEIGSVAIETLSQHSLGIANVGDGEKTARLIVLSDGLGRSGCPVYTPSILIIPETSNKAPGL